MAPATQYVLVNEDVQVEEKKVSMKMASGVAALCAAAALAVVYVSTPVAQPEMKWAPNGLTNVDVKKQAAGIMAGIIGASSVVSGAGPAVALTKDEALSLTYEQIKGTGLANRCAEVKGSDSISIGGGKYKIVDMCIEPKTFEIEEEGEFLPTKLMTRQTYTLDNIEGDLAVKGGAITFDEKDGIDYAATTVQMPKGERVPLLFTVKNLIAEGPKGTTAITPGFGMGGKFKVPSYRTGLFLDPKGRGMTTGYDQAVALPAIQTGQDGDAELYKENNKVFDVFPGQIEFSVKNVNAEEGEIGGVFVSQQPSDTDLGSKTPKNILAKGIFYGRIQKQ